MFTVDSSNYLITEQKSYSYRGKFVTTEQSMIPRLLGPHLTGDGQAVVLAVLVVALDIKVGEVDGDPPLGRRDHLPDAVLVAGVDVGEGGAGDGAVSSVNDSSARILTPLLIRVKLVSDPAGASIASQSVDTLVLTPMIRSMTLVILLVLIINKLINSKQSFPLFINVLF